MEALVRRQLGGKAVLTKVVGVEAAVAIESTSELGSASAVLLDLCLPEVKGTLVPWSVGLGGQRVGDQLKGKDWPFDAGDGTVPPWLTMAPPAAVAERYAMRVISLAARRVIFLRGAGTSRHAALLGSRNRGTRLRGPVTQGVVVMGIRYFPWLAARGSSPSARRAGGCRRPPVRTGLNPIRQTKQAVRSAIGAPVPRASSARKR